MKLALVFALALAACDSTPPTPAPTAPAATTAPAPAPAASAPTSTTPAAPADAHALIAAGATTKGSLYDLDLTLETQAGTAVTLPSFAGPPTIISMFYAKCGYACPTLIQDIQNLENALDAAAKAEVRVLLVTFDPEADTPKALSDLVARHGVDARWTFARAKDDEHTRELAGALGIKYRRLPDGHYNHSTLITLLDRQGTPLARIDGLRQDSTAFRSVIATALGR